MTKAEERKIKSSCKKGYARALKAAAREVRAREREAAKAERAALRVQKVEEKAFLKAEAEWHAQRQAEGRLFELPAVVLRDGTVTSISNIQAVEVLESYTDRMCLDVETSGYWVGHNLYELRTIQLGGEEMAVVFDALDPLQCSVASYGLKIAKVLHAHSASADVIPCVVAGLIDWGSVWAKMVDSVLIAKLIDPSLSGSEANGLKDLAHDLLKEYATAPAAEIEKNKLFRAMGCKINKLEATDPKERNGWYMVNRFSETMIRYAGSDVLDLAAVLRVLPPLPVDESVLNREREFQEMCAEIAMDGYLLDEARIRELIYEHETGMAKDLHEVRLLSEGKITNPGSSKVVIEVFTEMGVELAPDPKSKQPSAGKNSLAPVAEQENQAGWLAQGILSYRKHQTALGLLLRPLLDLCVNGDGRMRPTVFTINAKTGRASCVRPNGQQFSRRGGIRACVIGDVYAFIVG